MNRKCPGCGNEYPLTFEFFFRSSQRKNGFMSKCRECTNKYQREYVKTESGKAKSQAAVRRQQEKNAERNSLVNPYADETKTKTCSDCHKTLSVTSFYVNRRNKDSLTAICKACQDKRVAGNPARNSEKRRKMVNLSVKKWQENNPEKARENSRIVSSNRRARKRNLLDDFTKQDWQYAIDYFNGCCAVCGRQMNDMFGEFTAARDHWFPLSKGGHTIPENIVPLCHGLGGCNGDKKDKDPAQWLTDTYGKRKAKAIMGRIETFFSTVRISTREEQAS